MDFGNEFNRLSGDMAFRAYRANQAGQPDSEAQLFGLIQDCFSNLEMKSVRLTEIPTMFEEAYGRPLTTSRNLADICQSADFRLLCTVKRMDQLVWLEPTPEFAEFNRIAQQFRKYFQAAQSQTEPQQSKPQAKQQTNAQPKPQTAKAKQQTNAQSKPPAKQTNAQSKPQTKVNTNAANASSFQPPSEAETKKYVEKILPKDVPLEETPHYKMFIVEFAETLRNNFQDVLEFEILDDHSTLLWLFLLHLCSAKEDKQYRVSVSELPLMFRQFFHHKLKLSQKLVTTLQEDCYLVCQVEKYKNDLHVKPSDELVHFLQSDLGCELEYIISDNLDAIQDRFEDFSDYTDSDEDAEDGAEEGSDNEHDQPSNDSSKFQANTPVQSAQQPKPANNNANNNKAPATKQTNQPANNTKSPTSTQNQQTNVNTSAKSTGHPYRLSNNTAVINTVPSTPLVLNGTDIGTYGNKGREIAMKEHLEKERQRAEQAAANNAKQTHQTQPAKHSAQQHDSRSQVTSESKNKTTAKARNNRSPATSQWVKKADSTNNASSTTPPTSAPPKATPPSTPAPNNNNNTSTNPAPSASDHKPNSATHEEGMKELASTVLNEFTCGMCSKILRRPVEGNCCHQLVCYTCSLFTPQCPFCQRRVTWGPNHVVDHLMSQLTTPCTYKGCDDWVTLDSVYVHNEYCDHRPQPCPNKGCGASKHYSELTAHINTCPFGTVECECRQQVKRHNLDAHNATCKRKQKAAPQVQQHARASLAHCPLGCEGPIEQSALEAHLDQLVNCANYGCPAVIKHRDVAAHRNCEYGKPGQARKDIGGKAQRRH